MCNNGRMCELLKKIREAIEKSGQSRYAISKATGISQGHLSRLMDGTAGLSIENAELVLNHLGYRIDLKRARKKR